MLTAPRLGLLALLALAPLAFGCGEDASSKVGPVINDSPVTGTDAVSPEADRAAPDATPGGEGTTGTSGVPPVSAPPVEAAPAPAPEPAPAPAPEPAAAPKDLRAGAAPAPEADGVALEPITFDAMLKRIAGNGARLTIVDAWATWCGPCKENFPHLVQMHQKYADRGLAVASLSLDDPTDPDALDEARRFLRAQGAAFSNFLLNEPQDRAFDHLGINGIPAVFVYGPDGKEIKRFTMDDPNNQFTYEQVEEAVAGMLDEAGKKAE